MKNQRRTVRVHMLLSDQEAEMIRTRMSEVGMTNLSAYLRKMALSGYIIHLDLREITNMTRLLNHCSKNLNQYAARANTTGSIYAADIQDLQERFDSLRDQINEILKQYAKISESR